MRGRGKVGENRRGKEGASKMSPALPRLVCGPCVRPGVGWGWGQLPRGGFEELDRPLQDARALLSRDSGLPMRI